MSSWEPKFQSTKLVPEMVPNANALAEDFHAYLESFR